METRAIDIEIANHLSGVGMDPEVPSHIDNMTLGGGTLANRSRYLQYLSIASSRLVSQRASLQRQLFALQDRRPANQGPFQKLIQPPPDPAFWLPKEKSPEAVEAKPVAPKTEPRSEPGTPAPVHAPQLVKRTPGQPYKPSENPTDHPPLRYFPGPPPYWGMPG
jgi:hypothetical protein